MHLLGKGWWLGLGSGSCPNPEDAGVTLSAFQEACPGMLVRVKHDNRRPEFNGMVGVI